MSTDDTNNNPIRYNSFGNPVGNQVAFNRQRCSRLTLHRTDNTDEIYFTDVRLDGWHLIRGEYYPTGNTMKYPTEWGKKRAIKHFISFWLSQHKETVERLSKRIDEFEGYLEGDEYVNMIEGVIPTGVVDTKLMTVQGKKMFI
jgi:hypothetical protein